MTQSEFIEILESIKIKYEIENGMILILCGYVNLSSLKSLPENVQFNNGGYVYLPSLKSLPENTQFNNGGNVYPISVKTLQKTVQYLKQVDKKQHLNS